MPRWFRGISIPPMGPVIRRKILSNNDKTEATIRDAPLVQTKNALHSVRDFDEKDRRQGESEPINVQEVRETLHTLFCFAIVVVPNRV